MPRSSRPTIIDIARQAGVSPITVSYVLSGPQERIDAIGIETGNRVREAMQALGLAQDALAGRPTRPRTHHVLLVVCCLSSPATHNLITQTELALAEHGLTLGAQAGEGDDDLRRVGRLLDDGILDGLIVETDDETAPVLEEIAERGHPIVAIGPKAAAADYDVITDDDSNAIREATLHLVDNRYERFLLMTPREDSNRDHRITVARDQLRALGVQTDCIDTTYSAHDPVDAFWVISPWLEAATPPLAVVTGSDSSAVGVLWACIRAGLRVPEDVGILGYGGAPGGEITTPPLSTLAPEVTVIRDIAEMMASRIERIELPGRHIVIPWRFVARDSTLGVGTS